VKIKEPASSEINKTILDKILDFIDSNKERYIGELKKFLSFPSISTNPENKKDVEKCAQYVKDHLDHIGMQNAKIMATKAIL